MLAKGALILFMVCVLSGLLDFLGGFHWLFCRRYFIPILLGITVSLITHTWWLGLCCLPAIGTLSIGYSKDGNFGRALWIGLQCFVLGLGVVLFQHLSVWFYVPYVIGGCVLGGLYRNWPQVIGDLVTGTYLASFIFLVH